MKKIWTLALLSLWLQATSMTLAQTQGEIVLSPASLKKKYNASWIYRNWKYKSGDNMDWAAPTYDDSNWQIVDTLLMPSCMSAS